MKRETILVLFAVTALAQFAVPAKMILDRELAFSRGEVFKFRTAPVDPYDAFRGRYVRLQMDIENRPLPLDPEADRDELRPGTPVYVELVQGEDGFATVANVGSSPPAEGSYLKSRLRSISGRQVYVDVPLDRYYLPEDLAPQAERAYWQQSRRGSQGAFITVRIESGVAVIKELYLGGKPIREYLEDHHR